MRTFTAPWTADELTRLPDGWRYEIDGGKLIIMAPAVRAHHRRDHPTRGQLLP